MNFWFTEHTEESSEAQHQVVEHEMSPDIDESIYQNTYSPINSYELTDSDHSSPFNEYFYLTSSGIDDYEMSIDTFNFLVPS